ncbi:hypothetical protein DFJ74DRAFT_277025 [Hyaloraphidium curvatum]|nr:hypothetical protein DFJ74DRAFT_277025 [Hyaloraphidium curvatum]
MAAWSRDDSRIVVASTDHVLRTFDSRTGELLRTMRSHEDEIYVIDVHPTDPRVFLSAGHDGKLVLWDIVTGRAIKELLCDFSVLEARFSEDGTRIVAVDSVGYVHLFSGVDDVETYANIAYEQFFPSDYTALRIDANSWVVDEQTQLAPHLMPRVPVSSYFGVPWPQMVGREDHGTHLPPLPASVIEAERERKLAWIRSRKRHPIPLESESNLREEIRRAKTAIQKRRKQRREVEEDDDDGPAWESAQPIVPLPESSDDDYGASFSDTSEESESDDGEDADAGHEGRSPRRRDRRDRRDRRSRQRRDRQDRRDRRNRRRASVEDATPEPELYLSDGSEELGLRRRRNGRSYRESDGSDAAADTSDAYDEPEQLPRRPRPPKREREEEAVSRGDKKSRKDKRPDGLAAEDYFPTEWISRVEPQATPYRPQVGDVVAYVQQGHRSWVRAVKEGITDSSGDLVVPPEPPFLVARVTRNLPWDRTTVAYPPVVFGAVRKIEYNVGPPAVCRVEIEIFENTAAKENPDAPSPANPEWTVTYLPEGLHALTPTTSLLKFNYFDKEGAADFLVLFDRYHWSLSIPHEIGDTVLVEYGDDEQHEGRLSAKLAPDGSLLAAEPSDPSDAPFGLRDRKGKGKPAAAVAATAGSSSASPPKIEPWSCYRVRWPDGGTDTFSPWEIQRPDDVPPPLPTVSESEVARFITVLMELSDTERFSVFVDAVDRDQYPEYYQQIAYPMHFSLITARLQAGFYRRPEVRCLRRACFGASSDVSQGRGLGSGSDPRQRHALQCSGQLHLRARQCGVPTPGRTDTSRRATRHSPAPGPR